MSLWGIGYGVWRNLIRRVPLFVLARAVVYASLFVGFLLIALPNEILSRSGITRPPVVGVIELAGLAISLAGAALVLACVLTFVFVGKGTQAPFDPPRRLVISGPYRFVRNPMYLGATLALGGAAIFYRSPALVVYAAVLILATHLFVTACEEPVLERTFGEAYRTYRQTTGRWIPRGHTRP
ncbi:MAG TPA: isoprenylcysteine carboxylmethyltransferase family protein [Gemmatimonadaceae bacterium]